MRVLRVVLLLQVCLGVLSTEAQAPRPRAEFACERTDALIGGTVTFDLVFTNSAATGFGPFVDLVLDHAGADGVNSAPCDGLEFVAASVVGKNPEVPLVARSFTSPSPCESGAVAGHPYGKSGVTIPGLPTGAQLVTLPLPLGSFEVDQPQVVLRITVRVSNLADEGKPLAVRARAGFRYGDDEEDKPAAGSQPILDPPPNVPAASWPELVEIIPRAVLVEKFLRDGENEIVPGPNFTYEFGLRVRVPPGQTVTGLELSDCVPAPGVEFSQIVSKIAGVTTSINPQKNCFVVKYPPLTGPPAGNADLVTASFHATANALGDFCEQPGENQVFPSGQWTPADTRDDEQPVTGLSRTTFTRKAIALKKQAVLLDGEVSPGKRIEYRITFAISDYAQFSNLIVDDDLSDGQSLIAGSARFTARDKNGVILDQPFPASQIFSSTRVGRFRCPTPPPGDEPPPPCAVPGGSGEIALAGSTRLTFQFSEAMKLQPGTPFPAGALTGGRFGPAGGAATGELVFRVTVDEKHRFGPHFPFDEGSVDKHDPIFNRAQIRGTSAGPGNPQCLDDSTTCLRVAAGAPLEKRIIALNGELLSPVPDPVKPPVPRFTRDDVITFRITRTIPTGDAEELSVRDWLPQPVLDVGALLPFNGMIVPKCGAIPPPLGQPVCYAGPAVVPVPHLHVETTTNSITFEFQNLDDPLNQPATLDFYVTMRITRDPFADGLLLANEAQECERDSYGERHCQEAIVQFELGEPFVGLHKGILCAPPACTNDKMRSVGTPADPVASCGGPCPRVKGVNLGNFAALLRRYAVVDGGDVVTFIVILENSGKGRHGAYDVRFEDTIPDDAPGKIKADSVCVTFGDGTLVSHHATITDRSLEVRLEEPIEASPNPASRNLVVVTYDVELDVAAPLGACIVNSAELTRYSNAPGGANFIEAGFSGPTLGAAQVCVSSRLAQKSIVRASEHPAFSEATDRVWIGEVLRYKLRLQLPEGTAEPMVIQDVLPAGFTVVSEPVVTIEDPGELRITIEKPVTWWTPTGKITFTKVENRNQNGECEYLVVEFDVRVDDVAANFKDDVKSNYFNITAGTRTFATSNRVTVRVGEPVLKIKKVFQSAEGRFAGYQILLENAGNAPAFDVLVEDWPSTNVQLCSNDPNGGDLIFFPPVVVQGTVEGLVYPLVPVDPATRPQVTIEEMAPGSAILITYEVFEFDTSFCSMKELCDSPFTMLNIAWVIATSLPLAGTHPASAGHDRSGQSDADYVLADSASACEPCRCENPLPPSSICPMEECP